MRSSVHSGLVVLAIRDIVRSGFYERQVADLLGDLPRHISWTLDITEHLSPHVSGDFGRSVGGAVMDGLVATFAQYYLSRFPLLVWCEWYSDMAPDVGFSEADCDEIVATAFGSIKDMFPAAWAKLHGGGSDDCDSIYGHFAMGKRRAAVAAATDQSVTAFGVPPSQFVEDLIEVCGSEALSSNMLVFMRTILDGRRAPWWRDYRDDYRDTLHEWWIGGHMFTGYGGQASPVLRDALTERLRSRDWVVNAAVGWERGAHGRTL